MEGINGGGKGTRHTGQNILFGNPSSSLFCSFMGQVPKHLILFLKQNVPFVLFCIILSVELRVIIVKDSYEGNSCSTSICR